MFALIRTLRLSVQLVCMQELKNYRYARLLTNRFDNNQCKAFVHTQSNPQESEENSNNKKVLAKLEGKLKLMFTCKRCNTRNSKIMSKVAYQKGVVIVRCDGCKNLHLIADNLNWFSDVKGRNIEKIMALKGETVHKIHNDKEGYYEAVGKEYLKNISDEQFNKKANEQRKSEEKSTKTEDKSVDISEK